MWTALLTPILIMLFALAMERFEASLPLALSDKGPPLTQNSRGDPHWSAGSL